MSRLPRYRPAPFTGRASRHAAQSRSHQTRLSPLRQATRRYGRKRRASWSRHWQGGSWSDNTQPLVDLIGRYPPRVSVIPSRIATSPGAVPAFYCKHGISPRTRPHPSRARGRNSLYPDETAMPHHGHQRRRGLASGGGNIRRTSSRCC